ncbi:MAG: hypothetical protein QXL94_04265, partial [Candidatus Parvarchaeum sp.]
NYEEEHSYNEYFNNTTEKAEADYEDYKESIIQKAEHFAEKNREDPAKYDADAGLVIPPKVKPEKNEYERKLENAKRRLMRELRQAEHQQHSERFLDNATKPQPIRVLVDGQIKTLQPDTPEYEEYMNSLKNKKKSIDDDFDYYDDIDDAIKDIIENNKVYGTVGIEYKCPFDGAIFVNKNGLGYHLLQKHKDAISDIIEEE